MTVEKPDRIIEESVVAKRTSSRAPSSHWLFLPDRRTLLDARQSSCEEVQNSRSETLLDSHSAQITGHSELTAYTARGWKCTTSRKIAFPGKWIVSP